MPARRITAEVGAIPYVMGSSSAMVAGGPSPGRTPIAVPTSAPTKPEARVVGVGAIADPSAEGEQPRDGRRRPEPRQDADRGADERADEAVGQVGRRERDREPLGEEAQDLHGALSAGAVPAAAGP